MRVGQRFGKRQIGFDVDHRRTVDEIEAAEFQYHLLFLTANALQLNQRHANGIGAKGGAGGEDAHTRVAPETGRAHRRTPAAFHGLMKHKQDPQMAEAFQTTHGVGLVVGRDQMEFSAAVLDQTRLARYGKLLFIRRADHAYLRELKCTHCAETLSAEPRQTA